MPVFSDRTGKVTHQKTMILRGYEAEVSGLMKKRSGIVLERERERGLHVKIIRACAIDRQTEIKRAFWAIIIKETWKYRESAVQN